MRTVASYTNAKQGTNITSARGSIPNLAVLLIYSICSNVNSTKYAIVPIIVDRSARYSSCICDILVLPFSCYFMVGSCIQTTISGENVSLYIIKS
jgi:hypothetical protein